jgi:hypothetical protein
MNAAAKTRTASATDDLGFAMTATQREIEIYTLETSNGPLVWSDVTREQAVGMAREARAMSFLIGDIGKLSCRREWVEVSRAYASRAVARQAALAWEEANWGSGMVE